MNRLFFDHVKKGLQLGSIIGTFIALPVTIYKDMKNLKTLSAKRLLHKQAASLTLGVGISLVWMTIRYISWQNKEQKLHDETYYIPNDTQYELDHITTIWGGGTFLLTFLATRKFLYGMGAMSPVIAFGIIQTLFYKINTNPNTN